MLEQKSFNPSDVLAAVLFRYPDSTLPNNREDLHSAFFKIRKTHSELLRNLLFRDNILFPRSRVLDEILASLQPGFLGKLNPTYDTYQIKKDSLGIFWEQYLKSSLEDRKDEIDAVAKELKALLS